MHFQARLNIVLDRKLTATQRKTIEHKLETAFERIESDIERRLYDVDSTWGGFRATFTVARK